MGVIAEELHGRISLFQLDDQHVMWTCSSALVEFIERLGVDVCAYDLLTNTLVFRLVEPEADEVVYVLPDGAGCTTEYLGRKED